ncbi:MAG: lipoprotein-releasing ABC transporter ATP-binding protein LolD [Xanthomonadales bacterium]|nr:lipoprotein-releasing ABC transporter ATP-binding protein LolD [Xanthomonadales bacterium]
MNDNTIPPVLTCRGISKSYRQGVEELKVLDGVSLEIAPAENIAILGASGTGKSTLLHILGGLDKPNAGEVIIAGQSLWQQSASKREKLRNLKLGFIYQFHHLLAEFTALENVAMPLLIRGESAESAASIAKRQLDAVGLGQRLNHKPGELSGGERQRAAVARALAGQPAIILGDEPTGNLDETNASLVWDLMLDLNQENKTSLVMVTHDPGLAKRMDRLYELRQGSLVPV